MCAINMTKFLYERVIVPTALGQKHGVYEALREGK